MCGLRIIIVNYNSGESLREFVDSLRTAFENAEELSLTIEVVDNASSDDSTAFLGEVSGDVQLRSLDKNLGFGAAANQALQRQTEPWFIVTNADLRVPSSFFRQLTESLADMPQHVGIVAPRLRYEDGTPQPSIGLSPSLMGFLAGLLRSRVNRKYVSASAHRPGIVSRGWVTGSCLILRRECWEAIGGFDEHFFLYYEDVDLCERVRAAGYLQCFDPRIEVVHRAPLDSREVSPHLFPVIRYGQLRYFWIHRPHWEFGFLRALIQLLAWAGPLLERGGFLSRGVDWELVGALPDRVRRGDASPRLE
jgi:GT2 family glycosyltransferase